MLQIKPILFKDRLTKCWGYASRQTNQFKVKSSSEIRIRWKSNFNATFYKSHINLFRRHLNLVTIITTRLSYMKWNLSNLNISKTILRLKNVASASLRLFFESTCYWYRKFDKISTTLTNFQWHQIYTKKVTLRKNVHILSTFSSTRNRRCNFDIKTQHKGNIGTD